MKEKTKKVTMRVSQEAARLFKLKAVKVGMNREEYLEKLARQ